MLRPLGLADLLDELFAVYRRGFVTLVGISAVVQAPLAVTWLVESLVFGSEYLASLLGIVVTAPLFAATCCATSALLLKQEGGIRQAYQRVLPRFWALYRQALLTVMLFSAAVVGSLIVGLVLAIVLIALGVSSETSVLVAYVPLVLGLMLLVLALTSVATPVLVLEENGSAVDALRRSAALIRGAWWQAALTQFVLLLLWFLPAGVYVGIADWLPRGMETGAVAGPIGAVLRTLILSVGGALWGPVYYIGITLFYYDRRVRAEGFDLLLEARELGKPEQTPP